MLPFIHRHLLQNQTLFYIPSNILQIISPLPSYFFSFAFSINKLPKIFLNNDPIITTFHPLSSFHSIFIIHTIPLFQFCCCQNYIVNINLLMRPAGVYLVQAHLGICRITNPPEGTIQVQLRIGRNSTTIIHTQPSSLSAIEFNSTLQLNVDSIALQTQRCSITLTVTTGEKKVLGIALVSLPKDKNEISNTYKLTQAEDKKAEIDININIRSLDIPIATLPKQSVNREIENVSSLSKKNGEESVKDEKGGNIVNKIYTGATSKQEVVSNASEINLRSKESDPQEQEGSRSNLKTYKIRDEDKMVQVAESQLRRYREQKQAYYQMYKIEKSKSQTAARFISALIKKLTIKYPELLSFLSEISCPPELSKRFSDAAQLDKSKALALKSSVSNKDQKAQNSAAVLNLQQANRSLHRQIQEYKKIIEQLKVQVSRCPSSTPKLSDQSKAKKQSNNILSPNVLFDFGPAVSKQQKSSKNNSNIKSNPSNLPIPTFIGGQSNLTVFNDIDLRKWLQLSVGQRSQIQTMLANIPANGELKAQPNVRRTRVSIDRAFAQLLSRKQVSKQVLLAHKQQINKIFDQIANY